MSRSSLTALFRTGWLSSLRVSPDCLMFDHVAVVDVGLAAKRWAIIGLGLVVAGCATASGGEPTTGRGGHPTTATIAAGGASVPTVLRIPTSSTDPLPGSLPQARVVGPVETTEHFGDFRRFVTTPGQVVLLWLGDDGIPLGQLDAARRHLEAQGRPAKLLINGGIYQPGLRPAGLHIEAGEELIGLNLNDGGGNFHLKPNGVFWVDGSVAGVTESARFAQSGMGPRLAIQSGPMLTIDGLIHPAFAPESTSRYHRTGVGVRVDGRVVFLASARPVNLHTFAQAFLDSEVPNALYLDGGRPARMVEIVDNNPLLPNIPLAAIVAVVA